MGNTTRPAAAEIGAAGRGRLEGWLVGGVRIAAGLLWMHGVGWKNPARFDVHSGFFYDLVADAVHHEVFAPYAWVVREFVLPNFTWFAWTVWLTELFLAVFLLLGLATRFWAIVGVAQSSTILLSVANAPNEWGWSYWLMIAVHLMIFATAAGRHLGLDGLLRPAWQQRDSRLARLLVKVS